MSAAIPVDPEALGDATDGAADKASRERSTIQFPYIDLDEATSVARAIHEKAGDPCTISALAAATSHDSVNSGAFRQKVSGARIYRLIRVERNMVHLTPLGRQATDPATERTARAEAFLNVPLYRRTFEKYDGYKLPGDTGLESVFVNLGVSEKQKARARQIFQRSARQAGFFEASKDRLVAPFPKKLSERSPEPSVENSAADESESTEQRTRIASGKHPLIAALVATVPDEGAPWDYEGREKWLATAKSIFDLVYGSS